jgi:hypothetical protein
MFAQTVRRGVRRDEHAVIGRNTADFAAHVARQAGVSGGVDIFRPHQVSCLKAGATS